jgi:hypothetical protein
MAFHVRKVLAYLSAVSIHSHLRTFSPELAGSVCWGDDEAQVREQLEQILLNEVAGGADLIASLARVHQMANDIGDRAMIAACGGDIELRRQLTDQANAPERALWLFGEGPVFQLVAYLEGLPSTSTEFGDGGIVRRNVRPANEVTLVYAPATGVIDVVAHAGWQLREAVAKAFAEELFPQEAGFEPVRLRQVMLSGLARPRSFPVDPEDGIDGVRLTSLRLAPNGVEGRLTLEVAAKNSRTLHEISQSWFGGNDPLAKGPTITQARIAVRFHPGVGGRRARTLQVELKEPHGCNLRDRSDIERLVGEKYLKRWDLVRDV